MTIVYWIILLLSICTVIHWCLQLFRSLMGFNHLQVLPSAPWRRLDRSPPLPLVSVIISAKEEEQHIKQTIQHLLQQSYTNFEIIAVNDRSADKTGTRMEEIKAWSEGKETIKIPIRTIHITSLPEGWLGKNHAMYQGFLHAKGEIILFTDADVLFRSTTLQDAVDYMQSEQADHVTLLPKMIAKGFMLRAFVNYFMYSLSFVIQPHISNDDTKHRKGIGVGAFNMISREAYKTIGTHKAFPMYPDDDLELGRRVKKHRRRQRVLLGKAHIQVEWYPTLLKAIEGLEKNFFSGFNFSLILMLTAFLGQLLFFFAPFIGLLLLPDWLGIIYMVAVLAMLGHYLLQMRMMNNEKGLEVLVFPISCLLLIYVMVRSAVITLRQGGIYWRGTFYKLKELKELRKQDW